MIVVSFGCILAMDYVHCLIKMSKKIYFISGCIILNCAAIFTGLLGQYWRFFISLLLLFTCGILLIRINPFLRKYIGWLLIFGPYLGLLLIAFIISFFYENFKGYPLFIGSLITVFLAFLISGKKKSEIIKSIIVFTISLGAVTTMLPSYFSYIFHPNNPKEGLIIKNIKLYDADGSCFDVHSQGKIIVLDLWDTSCGVCIKEFPKFESLKREFEKDSLLEFYSVNLPLDRDNFSRTIKYTQPYTFEKLYADKNVRTQLGIKLIPQYIIIDGKGAIRYIGSLHTGKLDFYKNFYTLIDNIKNEQN